jgi:hypothetical protein
MDVKEGVTLPGTDTKIPMWVVLLAGVVVILVVVFKPGKTDEETDNPELAGTPSGLVLSEVSRLLEEQRLNFLSIIENALNMFQGVTPPGETIDPGTTDAPPGSTEPGTTEPPVYISDNGYPDVNPGETAPAPPGSEPIYTEPPDEVFIPPTAPDPGEVLPSEPSPYPPPGTEQELTLGGGGVRLVYAPDQNPLKLG